MYVLICCSAARPPGERSGANQLVLTVLAAIYVYLPMTLVTGTFGMDITGIRSEATAPDAWWAFGAWAVVFAVTLGVIFVYVLVRKHTSKQVA
jgi:Mg2+ and Co2+ transporter CorA